MSPSPSPWFLGIKTQSLGEHKEGPLWPEIQSSNVTWGRRKEERVIRLDRHMLKALGKLAEMSLWQIQMGRMLCINQRKPVGWALEKHKAAVSPFHCGPMPRKVSSPGQRLVRLPPVQGMCGSGHRPCGKGSPWMLLNNLEDPPQRLACSHQVSPAPGRGLSHLSHGDAPGKSQPCSARRNGTSQTHWCSWRG